MPRDPLANNLADPTAPRADGANSLGRVSPGEVVTTTDQASVLYWEQPLGPDGSISLPGDVMTVRLVRARDRRRH